ncbi:MAG: bacteriohemerythrin [Azonexus sp.]|nr:bacteriohemerythrin [Azonexus sp.]MDZ4316500.1 bacteriohemerythrin [Azonexus sp.]
MRIVWSNELETGVRTIDLQHEELIGMINELSDAHLARDQPALLNPIFQRLDSYLHFHFGTEEALMAGLPKSSPLNAQLSSEHLRQHQTFIEQMTAIRARAEAASEDAPGELVDFLSNWLYEHILKTDRHLGALLNEQRAQSLE